MRGRGYIILLGAVLILLAAGASYRAFWRPAISDGLSLSQAVYDRDDNLLRLTLSRDEKYRLWLELEDFSPLLIKGVLLHEDRWFYYHPGVNPASLLRALWHSYIKTDRRLGASTITMQTARLRYKLTTRTPLGKIRQIFYALYLECMYSKKEILEAYLNLAPYGLNIEGAAAAGRIYFGKSPAELNLLEALTLSVIPQSPAKRQPEAGDIMDPENHNLLQARNALFAKWCDKYPDDRDQKPFFELSSPLNSPKALPFNAPHLVTMALKAAPFDSRIRTTIDPRLQHMAERLATHYIENNRHRGITNTAVLLLDHRDMAVRALVGSVNFFNPDIQGQVNGVMAPRSPGSAIKPFIYALAMDQGLIHPLSMLKDTALSFGGYNPENFDGDFAGPLLARDALIKSRNVPAVELCSRLKDGGLHEFLRRCGLTRLKEPSYYGMTLALGSAEISMLDLVKMYAMLANGGVLKPVRILREKDEAHAGSPLVKKGTSPPASTGAEGKLLSPEACALTLGMLRANPRPYQGYQQDWTRDDIPVAWKTGTSYGYRDAWAVGVCGPFVLAVWVGNFDGRGNPAFVGRYAAAPLFFRIIDSMKATCPQITEGGCVSYDGLNIRFINVCAISGMIPGPHCSHRIPSAFIPGTSPIGVCNIHRAVSIDDKTGLRACTDGAPGTHRAVYEFWTSDMLQIFRQAGIPRTVPPPYHPACGMADKSPRGVAPVITSPRKDIVYTLRASLEGQEKIPLNAVTDADASKVYWFVDSRFIGTSGHGETMLWKARPGTFTIRAVDDHGRAATRMLNIAMER